MRWRFSLALTPIFLRQERPRISPDVTDLKPKLAEAISWLALFAFEGSPEGDGDENEDGSSAEEESDLA